MAIELRTRQGRGAARAVLTQDPARDYWAIAITRRASGLTTAHYTHAHNTFQGLHVEELGRVEWYPTEREAGLYNLYAAAQEEYLARTAQLELPF